MNTPAAEPICPFSNCFLILVPNLHAHFASHHILIRHEYSVGGAVLIGGIYLIAKMEARIKRMARSFFQRGSRHRNHPSDPDVSRLSYLRDLPISTEEKTLDSSDHSPQEPQEALPFDQGQIGKVASFLPVPHHHARNSPELERVLEETGLHLLEEDRRHRFDRIPLAERSSAMLSRPTVASYRGRTFASPPPPMSRQRQPRKFWLVPQLHRDRVDEEAGDAVSGSQTGASEDSSVSRASTAASLSDIVVSDAATARVVKVPAPVMVRKVPSRTVEDQQYMA